MSILINRIEEMKNRGLSNNAARMYKPVDFAKIRVGVKNLEDATYNLGDYKKVNSSFADKENVLRAISDRDINLMRDISNFYYRTDGIYSRLCKYLAYTYLYDWMVTPYIVSNNLKQDKILDSFYKAVNYLDNFHPKKFFGEVALKVIRNGCYYGYLIPRADHMAVQELPPFYCRSRFTAEDGRPAVEFNMKYFDDTFRDANQKMKMLKLFPEEFKKGYVLYKENKLKPDFLGDTSGWYLLDTNNTIKFSINGDDFPPMISVIPALIDLDDMQGIDRKKMEQQLLKIIIQQMPIDKNGDLVFDPDEAKELHNSAVKMLKKAVGIDVLTTFADTKVADMSSTSSTTAADDSMNRIKQAVFDKAGVSQMQFNTDGNIALEKSILNDEASLYNLIQQFEQFLNYLLKPFNKSPKKIYFKAQILRTTIYNYKDLAKLYKEQTQLGYSKMLPQIALGQSQSSILANAFFENDVLDLVNLFIPPMSSNTMNADMLNRRNQTEGAGRPTNESKGEAVSEKTIQNKESQQ